MSLRIGMTAIAVFFALYIVSGDGARSAPASEETELLKPLVQWVVTTDFEMNGLHDPLVVKDDVIVGTDLGELRAYRCQDGKSVWVQHGERVYFSSANGVTAVKVLDGAPRRHVLPLEPLPTVNFALQPMPASKPGA